MEGGTWFGILDTLNIQNEASLEELQSLIYKQNHNPSPKLCCSWSCECIPGNLSTTAMSCSNDILHCTLSYTASVHMLHARSVESEWDSNMCW